MRIFTRGTWALLSFLLVLPAWMLNASLVVCEPQDHGNTDEDTPPGPYGQHTPAELAITYDYWYEVIPEAGEVINSFEVFTGLQYENRTDLFSAYYAPPGWSPRLIVQSGQGSRIRWNNVSGDPLLEASTNVFGFDHPNHAVWGDWDADVDASTNHTAEPDGYGGHVHVPAAHRDGPETTYVSPSGGNIFPFASWTTAARDIQSAVNALGDTGTPTVIVGDGVYELSNQIDLQRAVTLRSANGPFNTIIDGGGSVRCIRGYWHPVLIIGFTLTGGHAQSGGALYGETLTARNCILSDNSADMDGGGACKATLENCVVVRNTAPYGGGVSQCEVYNSIVYYNQARIAGENAYRGKFHNVCTTREADPTGSATLFTNAPSLTSLKTPHLLPNSFCVDSGIVYDWMQQAVDADAEQRVRGASVDLGVDELHGGYLAGTLTAQFCHPVQIAVKHAPLTFEVDIQGKAQWITCSFGDGSVITNQCLMQHAFDAAGEYQLVISAGNDTSQTAATTTVTVLESSTVYVAQHGSHTYPFTNWAMAATNIQAAVDAQQIPGGCVTVSNGIYNTGSRIVDGLKCRLVITNPITVTSENGYELTTISGQGPDGPDAIRGVYLGRNARLSGFRITDGHTDLDGNMHISAVCGGGIHCLPGAIISDCLIESNSAKYGGGLFGGACSASRIMFNTASYGGGTYASTLSDSCLIANNKAIDGAGGYNCLASDCEFTDNNAQQMGGGLYGYETMADGCLFSSNTAYNGAGTHQGMLRNCELAFNSATNLGGGSAYATLYASKIHHNQAFTGGGIYECLARNSVIYSNAASSNGGGVAEGILEQCTVARNSAPEGGGILDAVAAGSIVYDNHSEVTSNHFGSLLTYCCTAPLAAGDGNFSDDPALKPDDSLNVYKTSPCINRGTNEPWMTDSSDISGISRIRNLRVDIGAYETERSYLCSDGTMWMANNSRDGSMPSGPTNFPLTCIYTQLMERGAPVVSAGGMAVAEMNHIRIRNPRNGEYIGSFYRGMYPYGSLNDRSIAIADHMLFASTKCHASTNGSLFAIDLQTGDLVWEHSMPSYNCTPPVVHNGIVYCGGRDSTVRALDAVTGELVWETDSTIGSTDYGAITLGDGLLYIIDGAGTLSWLTAIDAANAKLRWRMMVMRPGWAESPPVYHNGRVYVAYNESDDGVAVHNALTGIYLSKFTVNVFNKLSQPALADGKFYAIANKVLYAFNADPIGAPPLWTSTVETVSAPSSPIVANGIVFVCGDKLFAFDAATGSEVWRSLEDTSNYEPYAYNEHVFAINPDDKLLAFGDPEKEWPNAAPMLILPDNIVTAIETPVMFEVTASDDDINECLVSCLNLPTGAAFDHGIFNWTPTAAFAGTTNSILFTADDQQACSNSIVTNTANIIVAFDSDYDDINDGWEWSYYATLTPGAIGDFDHDGVINIDEYVAGSLPNDPLSTFFATCHDTETSTIRIYFTSAPGRRYVIEYLDDLNAAPLVWNRFANSAHGIGSWLETGTSHQTRWFTDDGTSETTQGFPVNGKRYYRIRAELP